MTRAKGQATEVAVPELNLTPMIDVVFQLIIFFMCAMKFKTLAMKLEMDLPKGYGTRPSVEVLEEPVKVNVALRQDRSQGVPRLEICGEALRPDLGLGVGPLPRIPKGEGKEELLEQVQARYEAVWAQHFQPKISELTRRAKALREADSELRWEVEADPCVRHECVVGVIDALVAAGITNVDIRGTKGSGPGR